MRAVHHKAIERARSLKLLIMVEAGKIPADITDPGPAFLEGYRTGFYQAVKWREGIEKGRVRARKQKAARKKSWLIETEAA